MSVRSSVFAWGYDKAPALWVYDKAPTLSFLWVYDKAPALSFSFSTRLEPYRTSHNKFELFLRPFTSRVFAVQVGAVFDPGSVVGVLRLDAAREFVEVVGHFEILYNNEN